MGEGDGDEGRAAGNRRSAPGWCGGVAAIYHWELRALSGVLCFGWVLAPVEAGGRGRFLAFVSCVFVCVPVLQPICGAIALPAKSDAQQ